MIETLEEMKAQQVLPPDGMRVQTKIVSQSLSISVQKEYVDNRRSDVGKYIGFVPGCGGDVWWIKHDDGKIGAYWSNEVFDIEENGVSIKIVRKNEPVIKKFSELNKGEIFSIGDSRIYLCCEGGNNRLVVEIQTGIIIDYIDPDYEVTLLEGELKVWPMTEKKE